MRPRPPILRILSGLIIILLTVRSACAWDYHGHRLVTEIGLASLPTNFPAFIQTLSLIHI